jgi:hypothetical protein
MKSTAMKIAGGFLARQGILVAFIVFMVGFTLWNPRFIDIDNVFGVSGPRRSSGSWRWV